MYSKLIPINTFYFQNFKLFNLSRFQKIDNCENILKNVLNRLSSERNSGSENVNGLQIRLAVEAKKPTEIGDSLD